MNKNDYQLLEQRVLSGKECQIVVCPTDNFRLLRTYDQEEGKFRVEMVMPWPMSAVYSFGKYSTRVEAQVEFERIDSALRLSNGTYGIRITSPTSAELVEISTTKD